MWDDSAMEGSLDGEYDDTDGANVMGFSVPLGEALIGSEAAEAGHCFSLEASEMSVAAVGGGSSCVPPSKEAHDVVEGWEEEGVCRAVADRAAGGEAADSALVALLGSRTGIVAVLALPPGSLWRMGATGGEGDGWGLLSATEGLRRCQAGDGRADGAVGAAGGGTGGTACPDPTRCCCCNAATPPEGGGTDLPLEATAVIADTAAATFVAEIAGTGAATAVATTTAAGAGVGFA